MQQQLALSGSSTLLAFLSPIGWAAHHCRTASQHLILLAIETHIGQGRTGRGMGRGGNGELVTHTTAVASEQQPAPSPPPQQQQPQQQQHDEEEAILADDTLLDLPNLLSDDTMVLAPAEVRRPGFDRVGAHVPVTFENGGGGAR